MNDSGLEEHREHRREEQALHHAHEQEERQLHQAHEVVEAELHKVEEQLHQKHVEEEEALRRSHEQEEDDEHEEGGAAHVEIMYNGVTKPLAVNLDSPAKVALDAAIHLFGIQQNFHLLSLYTDGGVELVDATPLRDQGVKKCAVLLLRPGTVKGG